MRKNQNKPDRKKRPAEHSGLRRRKHRNTPHVDLAALLSVEHSCKGCKKSEKCCCSSYEVCLTAAEMSRIIPVLPEAAKLCPHLRTHSGFDNVFEKVETGLFAIDTTEDGLCLFAFLSRGRIRCSLHAAASAAGLPLEEVKPKACLLWPMTLSEGEEVLSLTDDAFSFSCNIRRPNRSSLVSPSLIEAVKIVYGKNFGTLLEKGEQKG